MLQARDEPSITRQMIIDILANVAPFTDGHSARGIRRVLIPSSLALREIAKAYARDIYK